MYPLFRSVRLATAFSALSLVAAHGAVAAQPDRTTTAGPVTLSWTPEELVSPTADELETPVWGARPSAVWINTDPAFGDGPSGSASLFDWGRRIPITEGQTSVTIPDLPRPATFYWTVVGTAQSEDFGEVSLEPPVYSFATVDTLSTRTIKDYARGIAGQSAGGFNRETLGKFTIRCRRKAARTFVCRLTAHSEDTGQLFFRVRGTISQSTAASPTIRWDLTGVNYDLRLVGGEPVWLGIRARWRGKADQWTLAGRGRPLFP